MQNVDRVNGLFEFVGAVFALLNISKLLTDRSVRGVYWPSVAFWTIWGGWNLYYYPALGQWFSFFGGLLLVFFNAFWVVSAGYFAWTAKSRNLPMCVVCGQSNLIGRCPCPAFCPRARRVPR